MAAEKVVEPVGEELVSYELVIVVRPDASKEEVEAVLDSVSGYITGRGGTVTEVERWGKRRLAYPIKHNTQGIYALVRFQLKPEHNRELEANLRISENILRHLLVKLD